MPFKLGNQNVAALRLGASPAALFLGAMPAEGYKKIVAWGDSLTYGYTDLAGLLFDPDRQIAGRAVGGQSSTGVAARQGGVPIQVTATDNTIPVAPAPITGSQQVYDFTFDTMPEGASTFGAGASIAVANGELTTTINTTGMGYTLCGINIPIGSLTPGRRVRAEFEIIAFTGNIPGVLCAMTRQGVWAPSGQELASRGNPGVYSWEFTVPNGSPTDDYAINLITDANGDRVGSVKIGRLRLFKDFRGSALTALSVRPINNQGPLINGKLSLAGTLAGVPGTLDYDGHPDLTKGFYHFNRSDAGSPATAVAPNTPFIPSEAATMKDRTAWLWAGRNNYTSPNQVKADIAAMISYLGHDRFLVGSILNDASENSGTGAYATIMTLNADLLALYGDKFVDIRAALRAAGNGSANDNADIAAGLIPRSLRSDPIHLNTAGNAVVAQAMVAAHLAHNW